MVAAEFLGYIQSFSVCNYIGFEDLADRANFQWNIIVLLVCMLLVTVRQYFMAPLVCYIPTTVSGANVDSYITNLCWIEGTYPINLSSGVVPHKVEDWDALKPQQMNYYQWVPLVLGLQAILYYLPRIFWQIFTFNRTGTDLQNLIRTASVISKEDGEKRQKMVQHIARTLELLLFSRREYRENDKSNMTIRRMMELLPGKRHGNNLVYAYLSIKLLYSVIGFLQLYMMYVFLRFDSQEGYWFFGFRVLNDIVQGKQWSETQIFPRVGMCRHTLQLVGASNRIFAQCVLPINMLNEKIYIFLFFFLGSVMIITLCSIPLWMYRMGLKRRQKHFIRRFLKIADVYDRDDPKMSVLLDRFLQEFLRQDGHFILRMLSMNAGDLVTVEIVCFLFADYKKRYVNIDFRGPQVNTKTKYPNNSLNDHSNELLLKNNTDKQNHQGFMSLPLQEGGVVRQRTIPTAPPPTNIQSNCLQHTPKEIETYPLTELYNLKNNVPMNDPTAYDKYVNENNSTHALVQKQSIRLPNENNNNNNRDKSNLQSPSEL